MELIEKALKEGRTILNEYEAKQILAAYGIPVPREILVGRREDLIGAVRLTGFPLVMKGNTGTAHKTEAGLVETGVRTDSEAVAAYDRLMSRMGPDGSVLVQEMVGGKRELVMGMVRDPQFGPSVMFGLGGIFTEVLHDVVFRAAPLDRQDALDMMRDIRGGNILGAVRGMEPADTGQLAGMLTAVGRIGLDLPAVREIDINPVIISRGRGVAVDALMILEP